jgi:hypothetical protein
MKHLLLATLILFSASLFSQEEKTPQQIQAELNQAEADFQTAQKMFLPWYTGPLITGSANNVPKGKWNIEPYLYFLLNHAQYDDDRNSIDIPNVWNIRPLGLLQTGLTSWLDFTVIAYGQFNWREGKYAQGFGDFNSVFGVQLATETPSTPAMRLTIGETFPTGRYQRLDPKKGGIDAFGSGAYQTVLGFIISKVFWKNPLHPTRIRLAASYSIPNHDVEVKNFNAYGGGFGTRGNVCVGQTLNLDLGVEASLSQHWVLATDVAYTYSRESTFKGKPGVALTGGPASVGAPSSDQLSLAPAIEYNVSEQGGFIGGIWFSITGRNSANFAGIVLAYTWLF